MLKLNLSSVKVEELINKSAQRILGTGCVATSGGTH